MQKNIDDKALDQDKPYFDQNDLQDIHEIAKDTSLSQVCLSKMLYLNEFLISIRLSNSFI